LDTSVKDLAQAMANLFSWAKEAEALDHKLEHFRETIGLMAQQATECALFIKNYACRGFLGVLQPNTFTRHKFTLMQISPPRVRANTT
jgi:hypothetical protein